jgi:hypothetical protein
MPPTSANEEDIDPGLTGEDFINALNEKKKKAAELQQSQPQITQEFNPAIAPVKSPERKKINEIKEELERKRQEQKDIEELEQLKLLQQQQEEERKRREQEKSNKQKELEHSRQVEKDHPFLFKTGRAIKKILGATSEKINSAGDRFIQAQNASDNVLRKNTKYEVPGRTKKSAKRAPSEDDEIEEEGDYIPRGSTTPSPKKNFPFREFDSGSTLPRAAYLPKDQFGKEYRSVGVPVTLRMSGARNQSDGGMSPVGKGGIKGMPMLPAAVGKGSKKGMVMLDEAMHRVRTEPSDNSGMGEYKSLGNPITLKGGISMGGFKNTPVPNSLSGITLGGLGQKPKPTIPLPVMTKENITLPPPIPLKKKEKK